MHYQKRSQQYAEKKSFLRCEDLRVSRDLEFDLEGVHKVL